MWMHWLKTGLFQTVCLLKLIKQTGLAMVVVPVIDAMQRWYLISEGTLGLIKAIKKFDYTKGFRLITYAKAWIRLFMQKTVNQRCSKKYRLVSLDASVDSDDNESTLGSVLADMDNISVEDECENKVANEKLWKVIFSLKPNEREIIILHYGLCNHEEHSFEQIGAIKGRTRSRMQQIEKKAFEHLRKNLERFVG